MPLARLHPRFVVEHVRNPRVLLVAVVVAGLAHATLASPQTTTRVNVPSGGAQAQYGAWYPAISADGRYVTFTSHATNLVAGDTNGSDDVFVHDRAAGITTRVSVGSGGVQATGHSSGRSAVSADGRFVAFSSSAANLVPGDTNSADDVFVHDRQLGETTCVSLAIGGGQAANGWSYFDDLSADGRYVAFSSTATNLVPGDTNGAIDAFVHDRATGVTSRVSVASGGAQASGGGSSLSDDGRYVAFTSAASNLVVGDTNGFTDVFVHDRLTGITNRVSVPTWGDQANYDSYPARLSADGRIVVFASGANNMAYGDSNGRWDVFAHDRLTHTTTRVSVGSGGRQATAHSGGPTFPAPAVSAEGRYVTFMSYAPNLVPVDTNGVADVFVHDRLTGMTARVSVGSGGVQANAWSLDSAVSADGRDVAFLSDASNLVAGDTGPHRDVFVHDLDADDDLLQGSWESAFGLDPLSGTGDDGMNGDPDGDGQTNLEEYTAGTHPRGFQTRYLAEGATSLPFLDTQLAVLNPGGSSASVLLRFLMTDGSTSALLVPVPGMTRATVDAKIQAGLLEAEFSTVIESDVEVVVDRLMQWDLRGYGAHAETAVAAPALTWYLAEGATHSGFSLFYLLQNPNATEAQVRVRFLRPSGVPIEKTYGLPANSRTNIWVNQEDFPGLGKALAATDVSAVFECTNGQPIIVERALYLDLPGQVFGAGHESAGVTAPAEQWFLAEGNTGSYFDLFVLIANPGNADADVEATYLLPDGTVIVKTQTVAANSRFNIWVDFEDARLADTAVSTAIRSTNGVPVIVERALWWPFGYGQWYEAHNSPGATSTGTRWALAEGEEGGTRGVDTYILLANTSAAPGTVKVTLLFEDGTTAVKEFGVAARSRFNVAVRTEFPAAHDRRFGAIVESLGTTPAQLVVERAMYWNALGQNWAAGTNALAKKLQ